MSASSTQSNHNLTALLDKQQPNQPKTEFTIPPLRRFANRLNRGKGGFTAKAHAENEVLRSDIAVQNYFNTVRSKRGNDGYLSHETKVKTTAAIKDFIAYTGLTITNHTISDLVEFKRHNPASSEIELALKAYSMEPPFKNHADKASHILGIFRHNFAPLNVRVNTHFPPAEENCSEGTFRDIFGHLTDEQKTMLQWGLFLPERATATYLVPLDDIDLSRQDYAVVTIKAHHPDYNNKSKVNHPGIIPIWFAKPLIEAARQAGRKCPFPNYRSEWKKITAFAKQEYRVRLVSNYARKYFEAQASDTTLSPAFAAFLMGDKTKLAQTGHLPQFYNLSLRFAERLIQAYKESGLEHRLNMTSPQGKPQDELERLKERIRELEEALARKG